MKFTLIKKDSKHRRSPRCSDHTPRRHRDTDLHAGRNPRRDEGHDPRAGEGIGRPDHPVQHLPPSPASWRIAGGKGRGAAQVHGLERPDPYRLRRLPGLFAAQQADHRGWRLLQARRSPARRFFSIRPRPSPSRKHWAPTSSWRSTSASRIRATSSMPPAPRERPCAGPSSARKPRPGKTRPCSVSCRGASSRTCGRCAPGRWWKWTSPATPSAGCRWVRGWSS